MCKSTNKFACTIILLLYLHKLQYSFQNSPTQHQRCFVSNNFRVQNLDPFTYPLNFLNLPLKFSLENVPKIEEYLSSKIYKCKSANEKIFESMLCTDKLTKCPLKDDFKTISLSKDIYNMNDFCDLEESLHSNSSNSVRIIIFGGSVTRGERTEGGYCDQVVDPKCPSDSPSWKSYNNWPKYLEIWANRTFRSNIKFYHLYRGGTTSNFAQEELLSLFNRHQISSLNSNDLIFIDYSVNDRLEKSPVHIEELVRKILLHGNSSESLKGRPNIVLLAHYSQQPDPHYYNIYWEAAQKFNISFWSPHDLMYSKYKSDPSTKPLFKHVASWDQFDYHIPWYAHLFLADLYASMIEYVATSCEVTGSQYFRKVDKKWTVPINVVKHAGCHSKVFIDVSAYDTIKNLPEIIQKDLIFEHFVTFPSEIDILINPKNSWKLTIERKDKPGFVIVPRNMNNSESSALLHSNMTFWIPKDGLPNPNTHSLVNLQIEYLRTYENAGKVDVYLCGTFVACLDAMWKSQYYRYSLSHLKIFPINLATVCSCNYDVLCSPDSIGISKYGVFLPLKFVSPSNHEATDEHPVRTRRYRSRTLMVNQGDEPVERTYEDNLLDAESSDHSEGQRQRGNEKFKLISFSFCV